MTLGDPWNHGQSNTSSHHGSDPIYGSQEQSFAVAGPQEVTAGQRTETQTLVAHFEKDGGPVTPPHPQKQDVWPLPSAGTAVGVLMVVLTVQVTVDRAGLVGLLWDTHTHQSHLLLGMVLPRIPSVFKLISVVLRCCLLKTCTFCACLEGHLSTGRIES